MGIRSWAKKAKGVLASYWTEAGRRAAWNLAVLSAVSVIAQGCAFVTVLILTQALGAQGFGALSNALAIQLLLGIIGGLGAASVVIREGAERPAAIDQIRTAYVVVTGCGAVLSAVLVVTNVVFVVMPAAEKYLLAIVMVGSVAVTMTPVPFFDLEHQQAGSASVVLIGEVVALGAVVCLFLAGWLTLEVAGVIYASKWVSTSLGQYAVYHLYVRRLRWHVAEKDIKMLLRSGWPLMIAALASLVPLNSGTIVLRMLRGQEDAAIFGLSSMITSGYVFLGAGGLRIVQPHITGPHGFSPSFVWKLGLFSLGFMGSIAIFAFIAGTLLIYFLLDPIFMGSVIPLLALLLAGFTILICGILHTYLMRLREERFLMAVYACTAFAYVVGCLLVVPTWGPTGAGWMALAVVAAATLGNFVQLYRQWPVPSSPPETGEEMHGREG